MPWETREYDESQDTRIDVKDLGCCVGVMGLFTTSSPTTGAVISRHCCSAGLGIGMSSWKGQQTKPVLGMDVWFKAHSKQMVIHLWISLYPIIIIILIIMTKHPGTWPILYVWRRGRGILLPDVQILNLSYMSTDIPKGFIARHLYWTRMVRLTNVQKGV